MINYIGDDELVAEFQHNLKKANQDFLIVLPPQTDERNLFEDIYSIIELKKFYSNLFDGLKENVDKMMRKKNGAILFVFRPLIYSGNGRSYTPVKTQSMYSLMLSLSKELSAFGITVFGVILGLQKEDSTHQQLIKEKKMEVFSLKYKAIPLKEQVLMIETLMQNPEIFKGQLVSLGSPLTLKR